MCQRIQIVRLVKVNLCCGCTHTDSDGIHFVQHGKTRKAQNFLAYQIILFELATAAIISSNIILPSCKERGGLRRRRLVAVPRPDKGRFRSQVDRLLEALRKLQ